MRGKWGLRRGRGHAGCGFVALLKLRSPVWPLTRGPLGAQAEPGQWALSGASRLGVGGAQGPQRLMARGGAMGGLQGSGAK